MKLTCDLCGGELEMNSGGQGAVCTQCGLTYSMERLREKLGHSQQAVSPAEKPDSQPPKMTQTEFRMTAENVFWIAGQGTVVTGTIENGSIFVGSEVSINGGKIGKVDAIEINKRLHKLAQAGDPVGLLLKGIHKSDVAIGDVLTSVQETTSEPEEEIIYDVTDYEETVSASGATPTQTLRILRKRSFILFKVAVILDGEQCAILGKPGSVTEIPVSRGEHKISFRVATASGITEMEKATFHVAERDLYGVFYLQRNAFNVYCKFEMQEI